MRCVHGGSARPTKSGNLHSREMFLVARCLFSPDQWIGPKFLAYLFWLDMWVIYILALTQIRLWCCEFVVRTRGWTSMRCYVVVNKSLVVRLKLLVAIYYLQ